MKCTYEEYRENVCNDCQSCNKSEENIDWCVSKGVEE